MISATAPPWPWLYPHCRWVPSPCLVELEGLFEGFYPKPKPVWFSQEELSSTHWPQLQSCYCRWGKMPRRKTILNVVTWQVACRFWPQGLRTPSRVPWPAELEWASLRWWVLIVADVLSKLVQKGHQNSQSAFDPIISSVSSSLYSLEERG